MHFECYCMIGGQYLSQHQMVEQKYRWFWPTVTGNENYCITVFIFTDKTSWGCDICWSLYPTNVFFLDLENKTCVPGQDLAIIFWLTVQPYAHFSRLKSGKDSLRLSTSLAFKFIDNNSSVLTRQWGEVVTHHHQATPQTDNRKLKSGNEKYNCRLQHILKTLFGPFE